MPPKSVPQTEPRPPRMTASKAKSIRSGPVEGSINCGAVQTVSMLRLAYKTMINPERAITGGSFSTMEVKIPDRCVFNAREPAACEWYFTGLGLLADLMISCLSEAMPERATAAHYGDSSNL